MIQDFRNRSFSAGLISAALAAWLVVRLPPTKTCAADAAVRPQPSTDSSRFEAGTPEDARIAESTPDPDLKAGPIDLSSYDPKLADIITAVMEQEQRYANLESVVRTEQHYDAAKWTIPKSTQTVHTIRQGRLLSVEGELIDTLARGGEVRHRFASTFDGRRSVSVEYGDSANIHDRRYEPSQVFPPHTWGMFHLEVNFPLSVYLAGTNSLTKHPKVRRSPVARGFGFEFHKVECEALGSERIGDFDCEKVRVQRWHHLKSQPAIQYLWLAPERNYLCVKSQMMAPLPGSNLPSMESLVEGFQQLGPDLWLPERVRVAYYDYESLKQGKLIPNLTRSLVLESAAMPVAYPAGKFQLAIPEGIPLYTVGTDGVVDSPHHPRPATQERSTTLDEIRAGMRRNEALFENLDITVEERYIKPWIANEFFSSNLGEGSIAGSETFSYVNRTRSVSLGGRHYVREEQKLTHKDGTPYTTATIATTDGEWRRQVSTSNEDDPHTFVLQWPSLTRRSDAHARRIRAHALIFDPYDDLLERNLSDYLDSEWSNERNSYRHAVAYEGDDLIDGLLCHRLRIDHLNGQERQVSNNRYVWLCRDRNLLPIRTQWLESLWHPTLITGMSTVDEWRELKRGVWLPVRWTHVAFKRTDPSGLCENRLIHNWRKDSRVEEVTLDPRPDPELFRSVTAPRGTEISIRDASGKVLGKILQEQDGILTISPQKWRELSKPAEPATEGKPPADNNGAAGA